MVTAKDLFWFGVTGTVMLIAIAGYTAEYLVRHLGRHLDAIKSEVTALRKELHSHREP